MSVIITIGTIVYRLMVVNQLKKGIEKISINANTIDPYILNYQTIEQQEYAAIQTAKYEGRVQSLTKQVNNLKTVNAAVNLVVIVAGAVASIWTGPVGGAIVTAGCTALSTGTSIATKSKTASLQNEYADVLPQE